MNFRTVSPNYRIGRFSIIIFTLTIFFLFSLYSFIHKPLYNFSLNTLSKIYSNPISLSPPNENDNTTSISIPIVLYFKYFNLIFGTHLIYISLLLFYNTANVYKTFVLVLELIITKYISGLFKLIYLHPKPAFDDKLKKYNIINTNNIPLYWGFPNDSMLFYPVYYFSVWQILTRKLIKTNKQLRIKFISLCGTIIILIMYGISEFILCNSSLDQIIFSAMISLTLYYFIFYVAKINFNDNRQFYKIIKFNFKKLTSIVFLLLLIPIILYFFQTYSQKGQLNLSNYTELIINTNALSFNKEALASAFILFSIFTLFLGSRIEIHAIFMEQFANWTQFNFEPNDDNAHSLSTNSYESSLSERISITKAAQWNHTNKVISFGRGILMCILIFLCYLPGMFIEWNGNLGVVLIFKVGLFWGLLTSGVTLWFKIIARLCGLTNSTLWTMIRESV